MGTDFHSTTLQAIADAHAVPVSDVTLKEPLSCPTATGAADSSKPVTMHAAACSALLCSALIESIRIESNRIKSNRIESNRIESNLISSHLI